MPEHAALSAPPRAGQLSAALHFGFLLIGVVNTFLGPTLPLLAARWRLNDAQAGGLFIAQFSGGMIGSALSSVLIVRLGFRRLLLIGFCAMAASVVILGFGSWLSGILAVGVSGVAMGLTIPATNLLISYLYAERQVAALNLLNFVWGAGAMCSALVPLSARGGSLAWPLGVLGALMAALVVWLSLCEWRHAPSPRAANDAAPPMRVREIVRTWLTTPYAVLMGCFAFLSAGVEASTGGWVATYAQRFEGASRAMWALMPMGFYGGMLAGRGFAPVFLRLLSPRRLIFTGLAVAMVGLGIILGSSNLGGVLAGVCVAGLGLSTLFPTTFAYFTRYFGTRSSSMVGGVFVLTSLGSACLPWAVGFVSSRTGRLGWGLAGTLVATLAMTIVQVAIFRILAHAERS